MNKCKIKIPDLKSAYVEVVSIEAAVEVERLVYRVPGIVGHAHIHQSFHSVGPKQAEIPSDNGSPVVSNDKHLIGSHGVKNSDEVADHMETGVAAHIGGSVAVPVAAEVRSQRPVAERGKSLDLVAPGEGRLREAMDE